MTLLAFLRRSTPRTCAHCRHWQGKDAEHWGTCSQTIMRDEQPAVRGSKAVARDGERYYASLETDPSFGCVMWKKRRIPLG